MRRLNHEKDSLFFLFPIFIATESYSAPALKSNICSLFGEVISIEERIQDRGKPDSWIESWGLEKYEKYTDVTINITSFSHDSSGYGDACKGDGLQVFQVNNENLMHLSLGSRVEAKAIFSGDEFLIGTWIYDIRYP